MKKKILTIISAFLLMFTLVFYKSNIDSAYSTEYIWVNGLAGDYTFTGSPITLNGSILIEKLGILSADIFGDYVKQLNWDVEILNWTSIISTPYKWQDLKVKITPKNATKEYYGLSIIIKCTNGSETHTTVHEVFVHIPGGEPWAFPLNNYTGYIIAENIPRDLYLPMKGIPLTAWFKANVTGHYSMDFYCYFPTTGGWLGWKDVEAFLNAGEIYKVNYTFYPGSWGFTGEWHIVFKQYKDGNFTVLEEKVINITGHCPGHDENYYPFNSYEGKCLPDVVIDGTVDIYDLAVVCTCYGSVNGTRKYWDRADVNGDGKVDIYDVVVVAKYYGEHR